MAYISVEFFANTLGMCTKARVILPDRIDPGRPVPALYLLHGLSDDETIWSRRTALELYASSYYLAVVMPDGNRSFYSDMQSGAAYFKYVTEELPSLMESYFPLSGSREDRFICGLSMGGWGALKAGLNLPGRYAAIGALSAVTDISWIKETNPALYRAIYGDVPAGTMPDNLYRAAENVARLSEGERPAIFQYCGVEDAFFGANVSFREHLASLGMAPHWEEGPGGHTWVNWNERIKNVLAWLPLAENGMKTGAIGI